MIDKLDFAIADYIEQEVEIFDCAFNQFCIAFDFVNHRFRLVFTVDTKDIGAFLDQSSAQPAS